MIRGVDFAHPTPAAHLPTSSVSKKSISLHTTASKASLRIRRAVRAVTSPTRYVRKNDAKPDAAKTPADSPRNCASDMLPHNRLRRVSGSAFEVRLCRSIRNDTKAGRQKFPRLPATIAPTATANVRFSGAKTYTKTSNCNKLICVRNDIGQPVRPTQLRNAWNHRWSIAGMSRTNLAKPLATRHFWFPTYTVGH